MLKPSVSKLVRGLIIATFLAALVGFPTTGASTATAAVIVPAADGVECEVSARDCDITVDEDGDAGYNDGTGFTPAPASCVLREGGVSTPIGCNRGEGWWSNGRQCYLNSMAEAGFGTEINGEEGAYYRCVQYDAVCTGPGAGACTNSSIVFLVTPPPGITTFTPAQAARQLIRSFTLQPIDIGLAPDPAAGSRGYVGLPVWMWVKNSGDALAYGPYVRTATLGGVTITARANVKSILWNMGDGGTRACGNAGTAYYPALGIADSPTCGYRYERPSTGEPGGRYQVTATSQWEVTWTGGGQNGVIPLTATQNSSVEVRELQSVNVGN